MNAPMILLYNLSKGERGDRLRILCLKLHVRVYHVSPGEYAEPLGALAGLCPRTGAPNEIAFQDEMLVFVNFSGSMLQRFLQQMRAAHIPPIDLKAVLTPTNSAWTSLQLHEEISKEHEAMHRGDAPVHDPS